MNPWTTRLPDRGSTRRKGHELACAPSAAAMTRLQAFAGRSKRKVLPFPLRFVRDENSEDGPTLARVLRGGRGGEVRLKLLLSMHLIAVRGKHDVIRSPVSWAQMLDLPDPEGNGARRVRDATKWLKDHNLVRVEHVRGKEPVVYLLDPTGDGGDYSRPGPGGRYVNMPVAFWMNGWVVTLSGTALAMWLVIAEMQGGRKSASEVWAPPAEARRRYRLSEDTFTKGVRELETNGLVTVTKQPQGADLWLYNRLRNGYWLEYERLDDEPGSPIQPKSAKPPPPPKKGRTPPPPTQS